MARPRYQLLTLLYEASERLLELPRLIGALGQSSGCPRSTASQVGLCVMLQHTRLC